MLNFGISDLRIIGKDGQWSEETRNRAKNAQQVIDSSKIFKSIEESTSDCSLVIGTSGKREDGEKTSVRHFHYYLRKYQAEYQISMADSNRIWSEGKGSA